MLAAGAETIGCPFFMVKLLISSRVSGDDGSFAEFSIGDDMVSVGGRES